MPFVTSWSDAAPEDRARSTIQWHWSKRAELRPERWSVHFLVRFDGRVVGTQELGATEFAVTREVATGSWLGLRHQGHGIGTEMRAAVLMFAVDHLGATRARSAAFVDNPASLRVSEKLGYRPDGTETVARRGVATDDVRLLLTPDAFRRPGWELEAEGVAGCLPMLGVSPG
jgi:RimJ/RimL family protein N-acetyltransferase